MFINLIGCTLVHDRFHVVSLFMFQSYRWHNRLVNLSKLSTVYNSEFWPLRQLGFEKYFCLWLPCSALVLLLRLVFFSFFASILSRFQPSSFPLSTQVNSESNEHFRTNGCKATLGMCRGGWLMFALSIKITQFVMQLAAREIKPRLLKWRRCCRLFSVLKTEFSGFESKNWYPELCAWIHLEFFPFGKVGPSAMIDNRKEMARNAPNPWYSLRFWSYKEDRVGPLWWIQPPNDKRTWSRHWWIKECSMLHTRLQDELWVTVAKVKCLTQTDDRLESFNARKLVTTVAC